jgi:hypothetical protein
MSWLRNNGSTTPGNKGRGGDFTIYPAHPPSDPTVVTGKAPTRQMHRSFDRSISAHASAAISSAMLHQFPPGDRAHLTVSKLGQSTCVTWAFRPIIQSGNCQSVVYTGVTHECHAVIMMSGFLVFEIGPGHGAQHSEGVVMQRVTSDWWVSSKPSACCCFRRNLPSNAKRFPFRGRKVNRVSPTQPCGL